MTDAERERAAIVRYLSERHDYFMGRAGWGRVNGRLTPLDARDLIDRHEADMWVSKANAFFDARAAIEHGAHLKDPHP